MTILEKGYAVDTYHVWLYPHRHEPPRGVKLHLLNEGGVAVHGEWRDGCGFVAWQYLPKRDLEAERELQEEAALQGRIAIGCVWI